MAAVSAGSVASEQEAQDPQAAAKPDETPLKAQAPHAISPETTSLLSANAPKYSPPKPEEKKPDPYANLRDADQPRNKVIRLPKVVVEGQRPPIFADKEMYSSKGFTDLALKRYVADPKSMPNFAAAATRFLFSNYGREQYQEDQRLNDLRDLKDSAVMFHRSGDSDEVNYIKSAARDIYLQRGDFGGFAPENPNQTYHYLPAADSLQHSGSGTSP
jgi:hypothetical protein